MANREFRNQNILQKDGGKPCKKEIALIDLDCFHVQVMTKGRTDLDGKPVVVTNKMKKIIAVSYAARAYGVARNEGLNTARQKCPQLIVQEIPNRCGKPDQSIARLASYEIFDSIKDFFGKYDSSSKIEYSSNDEFFVDLAGLVTERVGKYGIKEKDFYEKTILEGENKIARNSPDFEKVLQDISTNRPDELRLLHASIICAELLKYIKCNTGYQASAGVGKNKLYAKLACGHNKPEAVTVFLESGLLRLSKEIKLKNIPTLGGKKGNSVTDEFRNSDGQPVKTMFDLQQVPVEELKARFGFRDGENFSLLANGMDDKDVLDKSAKASISCGQMLKPRIKNLEEIKVILANSAEEMHERLIEEKVRNKRRPRWIKIQVSRMKPLAEGDRPITESGTFEYLPSTTSDLHALSKCCCDLFEKNWLAKGQANLEEIKAISIIAKTFLPLEDMETSSTTF